MFFFAPPKKSERLLTTVAPRSNNTAESTTGVHRSIGDIMSNLDKLRLRVLKVEEVDKENTGGDDALARKRNGAAGEPLAVSGNATVEPQLHEE